MATFILGTGAIGKLWLARAHQRHFPVAAITRSAEQTISLAKGFQVTGQWHHAVNQIQAVCHTDNLQDSIDLLIVTTKAHQTLTAIQPWLPFLKNDSQILLLQNGMGVQAALSKQTSARIYNAITTDGAFTKGKHIELAGTGSTLIGHHDGRALEGELNNFYDQVMYPFQTSLSDNINQDLWHKLVINCAINPLTVLYQCQNGHLLSNEETSQHMLALCDEIDLVSEKQAFNTPNAWAMAQHVCQLTAQNYSSMYQDYEHRRDCELPWMTGGLLQEAKQFNLKLPYNEALYHQVSNMFKQRLK